MKYYSLFGPSLRPGAPLQGWFVALATVVCLSFKLDTPGYTSVFPEIMLIFSFCLEDVRLILSFNNY